MENHPYNFGGLSEVYAEFMMDMAGAAEIPATRLFGRSPQGMNSTGESDLINYYERIAQLQETYLRPALERLLPVMEVSVFGYVAEEAAIVFEPIAATTPEVRAEILSKVSSTIISLYQAGMITEESALAELKAQGREMGVFSRLKAENAREQPFVGCSISRHGSRHPQPQSSRLSTGQLARFG